MLFLVIVAALVGIGFCVYCLGAIFSVSNNSNNWIVKILAFVCGIVYTGMMVNEFIKVVTG